MNIILNLDHPVHAFSFTDDHINELQSVFPDLHITRVSSDEELVARLDEADIVATWRFPAGLYERAPRLKALFTPAAGHDWVATDPAGRVTTHYGSFHGMLMAESLLAMVLYFNRGMGAMLANQEQRRWERDRYSSCRSLSVQRALVVGYGTIGRACARALAAVGCNVTGVRRTPQPSDARKGIRAVVRFEEMEPHLAKADHVILVLPGGEETQGIFTREHLQTMRKTAYLYNLGRGNCYEEEDLVWALEQGEIAGAGLDVFAEEPLPPSSRLWGLPNTLIMPHASAIYEDYMDLFLAELLGQLQPLLAG